MKNFKNKLLMMIVLSSATTSILPLTFFDDGSIVHRGGPSEGREHFWNRGSHHSRDDRNSRRDDRDYRDDRREDRRLKRDEEIARRDDRRLRRDRNEGSFRRYNS